MEETKKRAEIILHADYMPYIAQLTLEQAGVLFMALLKKQDGILTQEETDAMDPIVRVVLMVIVDRADREREAYERISATRAESGAKGGNAKAAKKTANDSNTVANDSKGVANVSKDIANDSNTVANDSKRPKPNPNTKPIIEKEKESKEKEAPTGAARFVRPTLEEVEAYCRERGNSISAQGFLNYYDSNGWRVGKSPMKDWKAAVRTWEQRDKKTVEPEHHARAQNRFHNFDERKIDYDAILAQEALA